MDDYYMKVSNHTCIECDGKGFHWAEGKIISRVDGHEIATTRKQGPRCERCKGSGEAGGLLLSRYFAYIVMCLVALLVLHHIGRYFA